MDNKELGNTAVCMKYRWKGLETSNTDTATFERSVRAFDDQKHDYRRLPQLITYFRQQDPPSTGGTPRSGSPTIEPPTGITVLITPATTRPASDISAEKAIYERLIGPELPLVMDEAAVCKTVTEAV